MLTGDPESVAGEYGRHSLYKMLGYFSLVGLLRLHSLLGDYYQAIKVLENIELNKKVSFAELTLAFHCVTVKFVMCGIPNIDASLQKLKAPQITSKESENMINQTTLQIYILSQEFFF